MTDAYGWFYKLPPHIVIILKRLDVMLFFVFAPYFGSFRLFSQLFSSLNVFKKQPKIAQNLTKLIYRTCLMSFQVSPNGGAIGSG